MLNSFESTLQRYNALIHQEPQSYIVHCIFWMLFWTVATPIVLWCLIVQLAVNLFHHYVLNSRNGGKIMDPKTNPYVELAVVITGCDTGFGKDLVWEAAREGFTVFAGCLKEASLEQFQLEPKIIAVKMDVTSDSDVQAVVERVTKWLTHTEENVVDDKDGTKKKRYLHALVNNAGMSVSGLIDWLDIAAIDKQMQVNFYGMVRTTKAFLPIFKDQAPSHSPNHYAKARIINMISAIALNAIGSPGAVGYEASKHAAEAFTASLRWEMKKLWNVHVVAMNPSFHETPIVTTAGDDFSNTWAKLSPEMRAEYGQDYFDHLKDFLTGNVDRCVWPASMVTQEIIKCLQYLDPPAQVMVGMDARFLLTMGRYLPAWVRTMLLTLADYRAVKPAKMRE